MPNYNYVAINNSGKQVKGTLSAGNLDDLDNKLSDIGLEFISAKEKSNNKFFSISRSISSKDLILLCAHFEQLDRAGIPITQIIEDLRDSEDNPAFRDLMQDIYDAVKSGKMLSEAMAMHPKIFDDIFVGLIASGEKIGKLHESFNYLSEHLKWSLEISSKTKKAVRYPIFLLIILFTVTSVMMLTVIPKLSEFLLNQNFDLPSYTKALIAMSSFFKDYWKIILIMPFLLFFLHKILYNYIYSYAYWFDMFLLKIPYIGTTLLKIDISRFSQFFLITFSSGIDIMDCFSIVQKVVENKVLKREIELVAHDISDGSSISAALRNSQRFPLMVIRMFEIGENTGNMSEALDNIKMFYDKEVNDSVDIMVGMIQPTLTLIMGGLLLWISLAVFGPLYSSFSNIR